MSSILCDVTLWLEHAKELRALSEAVSDPEEKQQMLVIAAGFDRIARLAKEQRAVEEHWRLRLKASRHPARMGFSAKNAIRKGALGKHTAHVPALAVSASESTSNRIHHPGSGR